MVVVPRALLFDFGGVLASSSGGAADRMSRLVRRVGELTAGLLTEAELAADVTAGRRAYAQWRDGLARTAEPDELTHLRFWTDFVAADWPAPARDAVAAHATELTRIFVSRGSAWHLRAGVRDTLDLAREEGIASAVVSNTLCGSAMRQFLETSGIADHFAAQIYSDEVGIRKPHPRIAYLALDALGVPADAAWFIDDQLSRGILCARRAGVATAIHVYAGPDQADPDAAPPGPPDGPSAGPPDDSSAGPPDGPSAGPSVVADRPPARAGEEASALYRRTAARYAPDATVTCMNDLHALFAATLSAA